MMNANQTPEETLSYHIDRTLYQGRPTDSAGRQDKELLTYDLLDSLGVSYSRVDHDALPTIEACREVDQLLGTEICKNLFLRNAQKTDFYLLLMPGDKKFKTAALSKQIGSARLSFAGKPRPAADRQGRAGPGGVRLPPLYQHVQPQVQNPGSSGQGSARPGASAHAGGFAKAGMR